MVNIFNFTFVNIKKLTGRRKSSNFESSNKNKDI